LPSSPIARTWPFAAEDADDPEPTIRDVLDQLFEPPPKPGET
jgi:hypothetical protein